MKIIKHSVDVTEHFWTTGALENEIAIMEKKLGRQNNYWKKYEMRNLI